jgi:hypothetical protein
LLDVHPPAHTPNTWRDFFIHIATIVIGLLIAVGLEQTVEYFHHRHQRHQLVDALLEDTKATIGECEQGERVFALRDAWVRQRIAQVRHALTTGQPLAARAPFPLESYSLSGAPSWMAAKSSGLLSVLSQDEVRVFGEAAGLAEAINGSEESGYRAALQHSRLFEARFSGADTDSEYDFSTATPADLREYLDDMLAQQLTFKQYRRWMTYTRGAATAVLEGSRDLPYVLNSESRFIPDKDK